MSAVQRKFNDDHANALRELGGLGPTIANDYLKGYLPDEYGEVGKTYLSREDARRYAKALLAWAATEPDA